MFYFSDLTPIQERIVKNICYTQLNSLRRLYNNKNHNEDDLVMLLVEYEVSEDDYRNCIEKRLEVFKQLGDDPAKLGTLDNIDISMFRHLLTQVDEHYRSKMPHAVENLWNLLFTLEDTKEKFALN